MNKSHFEIYIIRIWKHPEGWSVYLGDFINFETGASWSLFSLRWSIGIGTRLTLCGSNNFKLKTSDERL